MYLYSSSRLSLFFFSNATAPPEIYTLSLHDALPISANTVSSHAEYKSVAPFHCLTTEPLLSSKGSVVKQWNGDRKSTRLNSSHVAISYAVFCLKKKKKKKNEQEI